MHQVSDQIQQMPPRSAPSQLSEQLTRQVVAFLVALLLHPEVQALEGSETTPIPTTQRRLVSEQRPTPAVDSSARSQTNLHLVQVQQRAVVFSAVVRVLAIPLALAQGVASAVIPATTRSVHSSNHRTKAPLSPRSRRIARRILRQTPTAHTKASPFSSHTKTSPLRS